MTKREIRTTHDRTESRPLLEEFQLVGDGVDRLLTRLSPQPVG